MKIVKKKKNFFKWKYINFDEEKLGEKKELERMKKKKEQNENEKDQWK